ncbi:MAG: hypothetical protein PSN34_12090 [Urechidicola sp.]|nr:hypothetical protein [Urechidicola sp.]
MKKHLISLIVLIFISTITFSQNNTTDIILKTNGEEMIGKVNSISDDAVDFVYQNETINYQVKTVDIVKITFSSGRIQFFNKLATQSKSESKPKVTLEDHHNKVAILPFGFIKDQEAGSDVMSNKIQQESYTVFNAHKGLLHFQPTRTTNALLIKAGVTNNNIQGFTMGEICNILGVEYVLQGVVTLEKTTQSNYGSSFSTTKGKGEKAYVDRHGNIIGNIYGNGKTKTSSFGTSTSVQNYSTSILINIYNDKGDNIFSQDHASFWNTEDAYKITLKYLAKKSPFYKK